MIIEQLKKLEQESKERQIPIIGSEKGTWLLETIKKHKPQKILELGTANGYSGIILASEGAKLTTIEINPQAAEEAMINFTEFNITPKIIVGNGVKIVQDLVSQDMEYDFIFIDFEKKSYMKVLENCMTLLKPNGVLIADNITMEKCQDFKEAIQNHEKLKTEIIDIKDGLSYSTYQNS